MKVLVVVPSIAPGGQEKIAINTVKGLQNKCDIQLVVFARCMNEYPIDLDVISLDAKSTKTYIQKIIMQIIRIVRLAKVRNSKKIDIVYSLGNTANLTNALSGVFSKGKTVISIHGYANVNRNILSAITYALADATVCVSEYLRRKVERLYPNIKMLSTVYNGIDISGIHKSIKDRKKNESKIFNFVAVGRLEYVKGFDRLLKAFAFVKERYAIHLNIVGDGSEKSRLIQIAKKLNIEEDIFFWGYQENPYAIMASSDAMVLSSRNEGFPNVIIEALACDLPVVSVDCDSGPREILTGAFDAPKVQGVYLGKYGILTENSICEDVVIQNLAKGMCEIIRNDELRNIYALNACMRANDFSNENYVNNILAIWEKCKRT